MIKILHQNSGSCAKCALIFDRYPGFYTPLRAWFCAFQERHPEAHISEAGRGEQDQEAAVINKTSKAHWTESAHNWNCAIDIFEMRPDENNIYDREWFCKVLEPELEPWLKWYGMPGSIFYELPHVEVAQWKALVKAGGLELVE